jgi:hypothetical protein
MWKVAVVGNLLLYICMGRRQRSWKPLKRKEAVPMGYTNNEPSLSLILYNKDLYENTTSK